MGLQAWCTFSYSPDGSGDIPGSPSDKRPAVPSQFVCPPSQKCAELSTPALVRRIDGEGSKHGVPVLAVSGDCSGGHSHNLLTQHVGAAYSLRGTRVMI